VVRKPWGWVGFIRRRRSRMVLMVVVSGDDDCGIVFISIHWWMNGSFIKLTHSLTL
jgi:hypothetical protein